MMMEEEIERTKEEIRGIEEACEKVEQVLEKVIHGSDMDVSLTNNQEQENKIKEGDDGQLEEIVQQMETREHTRANSATDYRKWYENEKLLSLWNGDAV
jgi:hypothetical protein